MMRIITYSLRQNAPDSDGYYQAIAAFTDTWLERIRPEILALLTGFREYRQDRGETDRSEAEYMFELLALGVHLREHSREASRMPVWAEYLLQGLVSIQNRYPRTESPVKVLRGLLGWLSRSLPDSLTARRRHETARLADQVSDRKREGDVVGRMIAWLGADDESAKEERFSEWREYFNSRGETFTQDAVSRCLLLADEFAKTSREALGKYTENVEPFLRNEAPQYRRRYDARLVFRTRLEYHLGMLGTEILNRAFRERFLSTGRKMVILPPCMCAPEKECKAVETPFGAKCQACTPLCRVNQITRLGEKRGFSVTMIPDNVKVFGSGKKAGDIGLVGVSCALTNWNGGWDAGALGIPAQGLLLDYVGCKFHWDKQGFPTDTNLKKLQEILGV
jgi:uncharacterized protein